ncbi:MAG: prolipoprotein diacylglyceryl transferase [Candidatus Brocadiaceae bacterium]|jgi:phosphatidylglycerol:prolipoprotein diacylglycerol transferase
MHPYLFKIPLPGGHRFPVASYGSMILVGFLVCLWLFQRRGRRMGLDPTALFDVAVYGLLGGVAGARLFYVVQHWAYFAEEPLHILFLHEGGLAFFGGLIGGAAGLLGGLVAKGLPLRATLDVAASLVPLGHAFGRMGCFLNGCCFGKVTHSWLGVRFPRIVAENGTISGSPVFLHHLSEGLVAATDAHSLPVHPTQLYAVAYNLAIFGVLSYLLPRRRRPGQVAWLYLILYGTARCGNEFLRADTAPRAALGGLTLFQAIAIAGVTFGLIMFLDTVRRPRVPVPEPWRPPEAGS